MAPLNPPSSALHTRFLFRTRCEFRTFPAYVHIVMDAESIKRLNEGTATPPEGETSPVYGAELMESIVNAAESRKCGTTSRLKATTGSASSARCGGGRGVSGGSVVPGCWRRAPWAPEGLMAGFVCVGLRLWTSYRTRET